MTDDDDLRLNTLHRFAKHSPKLILHEYSHCEVPAGCGGVVVRWIDPDTGRPAEIRAWVPSGKSEVWLDGKQLEESIAQLRPGIRVIAMHVTGGPVPFGLDVWFDNGRRADLVEPGQPQWRCTAERPADGWTERDFDDRAWGPIVRASDELIARQDDWCKRACAYRRERNQVLYALEPAQLWVRVAFTVPEQS